MYEKSKEHSNTGGFRFGDQPDVVSEIINSNKIYHFKRTIIFYNRWKGTNFL
jgi:hypothetical protein